MYLRFNVESQHLTRTDRSIVVARSENYLKAKFDFSPDWDGVTKTGVFTNGGRVYNVILDNDECFVPTEVIRKGCFTVSVFGGDLITADVVTIRVEPSGYEVGGSPEPPTPEVYEQVLGMFDKFRGGEEGQVLSKSSDEDLEFEWVEQGGGGGGTAPRWGNITGTLENQTDLNEALEAKQNAADAFSGDYDDLTNKPELFSGDYRDLTNKPELFSGDYEDLTNKPAIPTITANPTLSGTEAQLGGLEIDGIKYAVPSSGGAIIDDVTPSATKVFSSEKVSTTYLDKTASLVNAVVAPDTVGASSSGATVTKVDDNTYTVECNNTWCGDQRKYNLSDIGNDGITMVFDFARATGDANNAITFSVYSKQSSSGQKALFTFSLPADTQSIHYEIGIANATIQRDKWGDQFVILIGTQKVRIINESIVVRKGSTLLTPNVEQIKESVYTPLVGRKIIFLGDSITALNNERSWVNAFCTMTGASKIVNVAVDGAYLADNEGTVYDGDPKYSDATNNVLGNQVQKIINNQYEAPDIIIIAIGTNGGIEADDTKLNASYFTGTTLVPLTDVDRTTKEGAFRYCNETLHNLYPDALIVWCSPVQSKISHHKVDAMYSYSEALRKLTAYGSSHFCDTFRCGIHMNNETGSGGEYTIDGLHPNAKGALRIARYNADAISSMMSIGSRYKDTSLFA